MDKNEVSKGFGEFHEDDFICYNFKDSAEDMEFGIMLWGDEVGANMGALHCWDLLENGESKEFGWRLPEGQIEDFLYFKNFGKITFKEFIIKVISKL